MSDKTFLVGQKAFINRNDEILILILQNGKIDFPGGKIQEGETDPDKSLQREVFEETGLTIVINDPFYRWFFTLPPHHFRSGEKVFLIGFQCGYVTGEVQLSDAHKEYQWVNKQTYQRYNDDSEHYKALEAYFRTH